MKTLVPALALTAGTYATIKVDFDSRSSIEAAAAAKARDVMSFYHGHEPGKTPGILPDPYYWWHAGALWGTIIDYWKHTADAQYNDIARDGLLFQVGPDQNYLPPNVTASIGNDDQGFWAMSAMLAAETGFQDPAPSEPQWLSLVHAVYNTQKALLDQETACGGGLRWQVLVYNNGYNYKNSITNAVFFNMAARLAHYSGKSTYADNAMSIFQWLNHVGFVDREYNVWDGGHVEFECTDINYKQTSYLPAALLQGAAFMWSITRNEYWKSQVDGLLVSLLADFFIDGVLYEPVCDKKPNPSTTECTPDMRFYKGFVLRWMADTVVLCPWTRRLVGPAVRASARAALDACTGGVAGRACGMNWQKHEHDGDTGLAQEMSALSALMTATQFPQSEEAWASDDGGGTDAGSSTPEYLDPAESGGGGEGRGGEGGEGGGSGGEGGGGGGRGGDGHALAPPLTHDSGGTSVGDEDAGKETEKTRPLPEPLPIEEKDIIASGTLTALLLVFFWGACAWICSDGTDPWKADPRKDEEMQAREESIALEILALSGQRCLDRGGQMEGDRGQSSSGSRGDARISRKHRRTQRGQPFAPS